MKINLALRNLLTTLFFKPICPFLPLSGFLTASEPGGDAIRSNRLKFNRLLSLSPLGQ
jgi:hypothetical protein